MFARLVRPLVWILGFGLCSVGEAQNVARSPVRKSAYDLEVFERSATGVRSAPSYVSYDALLTLPLVQVKTEKDPNTGMPANYTGVLVSGLLKALRSSPDFDVLEAICYDGYSRFYDPEYVHRHSPILLLQFDGQPPGKWPRAEHDEEMGPYCIVHENFVPAETICGYVEQPRIPFGVTSVELSAYATTVGRFASRSQDPEVEKGERIAFGSCSSCHNDGYAGGTMAQRAWQVLAAFSVYNSAYFRQYVVNPSRVNPNSRMPSHPTFDAATLDALQAYLDTKLTE